MVLLQIYKTQPSAFQEYLLVYDGLSPLLFFLQVFIHFALTYGLTCGLLEKRARPFRICFSR